MFAQRARAGTLRKGSKLRARASRRGTAKPTPRRNAHRARKIQLAVNRARKRSAPPMAKKHSPPCVKTISLWPALPIAKIGSDIILGKQGVTPGLVPDLQAGAPAQQVFGDMFHASLAEIGWDNYQNQISTGPVMENAAITGVAFAAHKIADWTGINTWARKMQKGKIKYAL